MARVAASSRVETSQRERACRSDEKADKKAAKAEKKAQKKEKQKADLADSAQFKGFDKVVVAELHFDDDDVKKSGFDLPYDAEKTRVGGVLPPLYAVAATSNAQGAHA